MGTIFFLIIFPLVVAVALLLLKTDAARGAIVKIGAAVIAVASVILAVQYYGVDTEFFALSDSTSSLIGYTMMAVEVILAVVIIVLGIKYKKYLASLLAVVQTPIMIWYELSVGHHIAIQQGNIYIDKLSIIMVLIIFSAISVDTPALRRAIIVFVTIRLSAAAFLPFPIPSLTTITIRPSSSSCHPQQSPLIFPLAAHCDMAIFMSIFSDITDALLIVLLFKCHLRFSII